MNLHIYCLYLRRSSALDLQASANRSFLCGTPSGHGHTPGIPNLSKYRVDPALIRRMPSALVCALWGSLDATIRQPRRGRVGAAFQTYPVLLDDTTQAGRGEQATYTYCHDGHFST